MIIIEETNNKKVYLWIVFAVIAVAVATSLVYYFGWRRGTAPRVISEEDARRELIKSLTAPSMGEPVSASALKLLTAPTKGKPVSSDALKSLTAPVK